MFIGSAVTVQKYPLLVLENLPFLIERKHYGAHVWGELFKVSDTLLEFVLDRLESHPVWYIRKKIYVTLRSKETQYAWAYFLNDDWVPNKWRSFPALSSYKFGGQFPPASET